MEHHFFRQGLQSLAFHTFGLHLGKDGFEVCLFDFSSADLVQSDEEVVHRALAEDGVVSVVGMCLHETTHPLGKGKSLT